MHESRNTRQRELILNCLKKNSSKHLTMPELENLLDKTGNHVGSATIYRHLSRLVELNTVRKFKLDGQNSACYQYIENTDVCCEHFHLICSKCARTVHFQNDKLASIFLEMNKNNRFKIDLPKTIFYGLCEKCSLE